jgi:Rhodopirellula transposase DDE domain
MGRRTYCRPPFVGASLEGGAAIDRSVPVRLHDPYHLGKPLVSQQVIAQLVAATTTKIGLKLCCELDQNIYPAGIKVSTPKWMPSTSPVTTSTASGTTPSTQKPSPWSDSSRTGP